MLILAVMSSSICENGKQRRLQKLYHTSLIHSFLLLTITLLLLR